MEEIIDAKVVVVGGGVVGLASALELQKAGHNTVLVEKNSLLGDEVSSRNSGVVHSGIYYPTGSLKASLTFEGNQLLYSYAKKNNIPINQVGKIIFGKEGDEESIAALLKNGDLIISGIIKNHNMKYINNLIVSLVVYNKSSPIVTKTINGRFNFKLPYNSVYRIKFNYNNISYTKTWSIATKNESEINFII